ncbi:MAG: hypothetical protein ACHQ1G_13845 [Planctomycetota bacterium]
MRRLLALSLLLSPLAAASDDLAETLRIARERLDVARGEFKKLAMVEKEALRDARKTVAATARGRALAPAFAAAADLLEGASGDEALLIRMVRSYRAMSDELDKKVAPEAKADALNLLEEGAAEKQGDEARAAWNLLKRGDPRYRALAANMEALKAALSSLGERDGAKGQALAAVAKLNKALEPYFEGVDTTPPAPPESDCPT